MFPQLPQVVANWRAVMDSLISRHAVRLLKLRVDEIEVKVRVSNSVDGAKQVGDQLADVFVSEPAILIVLYAEIGHRD